jgi:hypothetical protein
LVPVRNPADAVVVNSGSLSDRNIMHRNVGLDFRSKLLTAEYFIEGLDNGARNVDGKVSASINLTSHLDPQRGRLADVETYEIGCDSVPLVCVISLDLRGGPLQLGSVNLDFWPMGRVELFSSQFERIVRNAGTLSGGTPEGECKNRNEDGSDGGGGIARFIQENAGAVGIRARGINQKAGSDC